MAKEISFGLSQKEIQRAIKEIRSYQDSLTAKCEELCRRLTAEGILIANSYVGNSGFGKYVHLGTEISPQQSGCKAILYMQDITKIRSDWQTLEGIRSADVSPMLMLEFGSGLKADNPAGIVGVGTGTFPGGKHGTKPGWYYMDLDGNWHYSTGISPKMPMYYSGKELREKVLTVARDVFG